MDAFIDQYPWAFVVLMISAPAVAGMLLLSLQAPLARVLPRGAAVPVAAGACFLACFAFSALPVGGDRRAAELIAAFGVAGILLLMAAWGQRRQSRADGLGMRQVGSFPSTVLQSEEGGLTARLTLGESGNRSSQPACDRLEVEADVSALGTAKVSARRLAPRDAGLPDFLTENLDGLFGGSGVHWRDQSKARGPQSWEGWEFWGSPPEAAALVFGRAKPPESQYGAGPRLRTIGVRGGRLRCQFESRLIDAEGVAKARAFVREFAERLGAGGAPPSGPANPI